AVRRRHPPTPRARSRHRTKAGVDPASHRPLSPADSPAPPRGPRHGVRRPARPPISASFLHFNRYEVARWAGILKAAGLAPNFSPARTVGAFGTRAQTVSQDDQVSHRSAQYRW